jgi:hypothetical protein
MSATNAGKDVVYIDVEEEITGIIDKVRSSEQRIVALVLPKRASAMQSIVNMKLLKRTADEAKKHVVLITAEAGLLPLAGNVGLYVARNLQSKPEIPNQPASIDDGIDEIDEPGAFVSAATGASAAAAAQLDKAKPVGQFAGASSIAANGGLPDEDETIEMDDEPDVPADDKPSKAKAAKGSKSAKGGFKIPDFNKFRLWLALGGLGVVLLIVALYVMFAVMPKANVAIKTNSSAIPANTSVTLSSLPGATVNVDRSIVPGTTVEVIKTLSQQADATGELDKGSKATGQVTIRNCGPDEATIPVGTAVSAGGLTFITQQTLNLDDGKFGGVCKSAGEHIGTVDVVAQQGGEKYNFEPRSDYKVAGQGSDVTANGTKMAGGTTDVVKLINQADIDTATQKIGQQDTTAIKQELEQQLKAKNVFVFVDTFKASDAETTTSAKAGDQAASVTVTQKLKYTMMGAKETDIRKLLGEEIASKIDTKTQTILSYGLDKAAFTLQSQNEGGMVVGINSKIIVGSDIDTAAIKKQVAGKKSAEASELIKDYPGVTDVKVTYSPFWVSSIPSKTNKITVQVEEPKVSDVKSE